jgi:uncharacterized membrane protein YoaT (DUF817 family)
MGLLREFVAFGLKQAYACLFGGALLLGIGVTHLWYPVHALHRYDFLLLYALAIQGILLVTRLESPQEALVILVFHALATAMEVFKTSDAIQSWRYPEAFSLGIANVPLFAGFMYSAVGSYIARIWKIFDFRFDGYPRRGGTLVLALLIYVNFFTHHFAWDLRWVLFLVIAGMFWRVTIYFRVIGEYRSMPLLLGWALVALFIWLAENAATFGSAWVYPNQAGGWRPVGAAKLGSWYLLMILSFVLVSLAHAPKASRPCRHRSTGRSTRMSSNADSANVPMTATHAPCSGSNCSTSATTSRWHRYIG